MKRLSWQPPPRVLILLSRLLLSRTMSTSTTTPKPPSASKKAPLPPSPNSPWDDNDDTDGNPQDDLLKNQILSQLEKEIETDEWKANALKNNIFRSPGVRPLAGNRKSASNANGSKQEGIHAPPAVDFKAMSIAPGKRLRLK